MSASVAATTSGGDATFTVGDAKAILTTTYPKLYSRFNYAFHGCEDATPLAEVVAAIKSDVRGWLNNMPDNFKTSNHALSRPKFGLIFVLKNEQVRAVLGEEECDATIDAIESAWEACKRELVAVVKDESTNTVDDHSMLVNVLSDSLVALVNLHYDDVVAALVQNLIRQVHSQNGDEALAALLRTKLNIR